MAASLVHFVFVRGAFVASFAEKTRADEGFCHRKGGHSWQRATVFQVTLLLPADSPGNADAAPRLAGREVDAVGRLMGSS